MEIPVIYEDEHMLVVNKPAGILAYPLPGSSEPASTKIDSGRKTVGDLVGGIPVHRLDRDTSGLMILAKNEKAKEELQQLFAERDIQKKYTALVWGKVEPERGEINIPLGRGSKDRLRVVPAHEGRASATEYEVVKYFPNSDMSLLKVNLKTGRTHQIRVHFGSIGHPVVGDPKYSNKKTKLKRQFLNADEIKFKSPFDQKEIDLKIDLPKELSDFLPELS